MRLGLMLGYSGPAVDFPVDLVRRAEHLGYRSVWTSEAYGTDAITPLAWLAGQTSTIMLGTAVMQMAGRPPAMCAMQAMTVDGLAGGGRMIAGLGASGPQIVEGWYGQPWGRPYWRARDYVQIMRKVIRRQQPLSHDGREISLPYQGEGSTGLGKALKTIVHPADDIPIYLGCGSDSMVRLCGELCDGIFPHHFVPSGMPELLRQLDIGFRRADHPKSRADFCIEPIVRVLVSEDITDALNAMKPKIALYVGGMGHPTMNFHKAAMQRAGFADAAGEIEALFRDGRKAEAAAAVPDEYVDDTVLIGSPQRIRQRLQPWFDCGIDTLIVSTRDEIAVQTMAEIVADL